MKIVKDTENEVKNSNDAGAETNRPETAKITPHFDLLSTKGVEMFKNMGDIENAKLWATDYMMTVSGDNMEIAGLIVLLQAILDKVEAGNCLDAAEDFIIDLQSHLFSWTREFSSAQDAYIKAIKSGDFIVDELVQSDAPDAPQPEEAALKAAA